jgi:hypothetical protein
MLKGYLNLVDMFQFYMSTQIRTGVIRLEVGDNKPLYDTHNLIFSNNMIMLFNMK